MLLFLVSSDDEGDDCNTSLMAIVLFFVFFFFNNFLSKAKSVLYTHTVQTKHLSNRGMRFVFCRLIFGRRRCCVTTRKITMIPADLCKRAWCKHSNEIEEWAEKKMLNYLE